jgi:hypothetical protein
MAGESECMLLTSEEVFDQKQLLVLHIIGLLVVVLATVTVPYLPAGNLIVFTAIR